MFLIEIHGMCKYCLVVVFHILIWNVYNFLSNVRLFLSIFTFTHHHATHSIVLSIYFFHSIPMF